MAGTSAVENLDLSFVQIDKGQNTKIKQSDVLDLSFLEQPVKQEDNRSTLRKVGDFFTGADRETEQTKGLKEFDLPFEFKARQAKTALGLLTTFDPKGQVAILKRNYPDLKFEEDEKGNFIVDGSAYGADKGVLNIPGISGRDLLQAGFQVALFTPAGKAASTAGGIAGNALRVGAASATTQAGQDLASQASGRTEDISLSNINKGDVAVVGLGGAAFQALFPGLGKAIPALRKKIAESGITDEVRTSIKQTAVRLGLNADDVTDDVIKQIANQADDAVNPNQALALQGEKEFGIPLTAGQRSLDDAALSFEDRARAGIQGESAQRIVRGFEQEKQIPAINAARQQIEQKIGGQPLTRQQAGATIRQGIQHAEQVADTVVQEAYSQVGDATLKPEGLNKLFNATRKAVIGIDKDRSLPATKSLLDQIKRSQKVLSTLNKAGAKIKGTHIREIEALRRRINTAINSADINQDMTQLVSMKNSFDDYLDVAVKNALFEGDDASLQALKSARGLFREYAKKFRASPTRLPGGRQLADREGGFIEKIIADNPTDEQIVNAVFGASSFNNTAGQRMASRFKTILGEDSDGWKAIRQEAFRRLVKTNKVNNQEIVSGQQTLKAIDEALDKNGSLIREIFGQDEISQFKRFAAQVKRTQPDLVRSRENPSGTAQVLAKTLSDMARRITGFLGDPTLMVGTKGVEVLKGVRSASKAKSAVKPFEAIIQANPNIVGATTGGAVEIFGNN